jgi:hypothetical protein
MPVNCQPDSNCPTPSKCSEFVDASCVYLNDGIYDAALPAKTSVEEAIQQLTLMITNPECTDTSSCNCPGGGGGSFDGDQGIYKDTSTNPDTFTLGAPDGSQSSIPFQENRFISTASHFLSLQGTGSLVLRASTSASLGRAIYGNAPSGIGVAGDSNDANTFGVKGTSKDGVGLSGESTNALALLATTTSVANSIFQTNSTNLTDKLDLIDIRRNYTGGTPVTGSGTSIETSLNNVVGTRISTVYEDVNTNEIGLEIQTKAPSLPPSIKLALGGGGQLQLHEYGAGTFADTPTYILGVNAQGKVVETTGGTYSVTNGLTEDPANTFKLGGTLTEDTTISGDNQSRSLTLSSLKSFLVDNADDVAIKSNGNVSTYAENLYAYSKTNGLLLQLNQTLGQLSLYGYYASTGVLYTPTPAYALGVDNIGNVLKVQFNTGGTGTITGDNGITDNTTSNVRLGGPLVQDTQIAGGTSLGGPHDLAIGDPGSSDPMNVLTLHANNLRLNTPAVTAATAVNNQVFTLTNQATGQGEWRNPLILTTDGSGAATYSIATGTLNIPTPPAATVYTVDNGLSATPTSNNFRLGGTLLQNTTISAVTNRLQITGTVAGGTVPVVDIVNTGTAAAQPALFVRSAGGLNTDALTVSTTAGANSAIRVLPSAASLSGITIDYPGDSNSTGRAGLIVNSTASAADRPAAIIARNSSNTATVQLIKQLGASATYSGIQNLLTLRCSGNALVGGGVGMRFELIASTGSTQEFANGIHSSWSVPTDGSLTSSFVVRGRNNNANIQVLEITGNNIFKIFGGLPEYANNGAATGAGLSPGCLYRTGENVKIVF